MADVRPFRALRPRADAAARVHALPYDVMSTDEARAMAAGNPDSYLHVTRPEIDLPPGIDEHGPAVYARAVQGLAELRRRGVLEADPAAALYVYRLESGGHAQTGVVGAFSVDEYDRGLVVKHELTRPDKEEDRTRHILDLEAHAEPVFLLHRPHAAVAALVQRTQGRPALYDLRASDGVRHALWRVEESEALSQALRGVTPLYIADGHHRAAAASNARRRRPGVKGAERFLAVAFPTTEARILPYNRLVKDLNGLSPAAFLDALAKVGRLHAAEGQGPAGPDPVAPGDVRVFLGQGWRRLDLAVPAGGDPVARLDCSLLQDRVLGPLLGIDDPRTSKRIEFVGGIRGTGALEEAVRGGRAAVAFSLRACTPDELLAVADAGKIMPPKSTWFEPKLRSGLFVLPFDL